MNPKSFFTIEINNHLTHEVKSVYIDHYLGSVAARKANGLFPIGLTQADLDFILTKLDEAKEPGSYRMLSDGARLLPLVISTLGGLTLPARMVDFTLLVSRIEQSGPFISDLKIQKIQTIRIKGKEGRGAGERCQTTFSMVKTTQGQATVATELVPQSTREVVQELDYRRYRY